MMTWEEIVEQMREELRVAREQLKFRLNLMRKLRDMGQTAPTIERNNVVLLHEIINTKASIEWHVHEFLQEDEAA